MDLTDASAFQANTPEALNVDWTRLPDPCRIAVVRQLDATSRASWRLTHRQACNDVWEETFGLSWRGNDSNHHSTMQIVVPCTSLMPLALKRPYLQRLHCDNMKLLRSMDGVPPGLLELQLSHCSGLVSTRALQQCTQLAALTCTGDVGCMSELEPVLKSLTVLTALSFITPQSTAASALAPAIAALINLRALHWDTASSRPLYAPGMAVLAPALHQLHRLQTLRLIATRIGKEGAAALAPALLHLSHLTELQLSDNGLCADSALLLVPALKKLASLKVLGLSRNYTLCIDGGQAVGAALKDLQGLQGLDLSRVCIGDKSVAQLSAALLSLTALTRLCLRFCDISVSRAPALAAAFAAMPGMRELDLSGNALLTPGLSALAPALSNMAGLVRLELSDIRMRGAQDAAVVATICTGKSALEHLSLGDNVLPAEGVAELAPALHSIRHTLLSLDLNTTCLGLAGATALAPTLGTLTHLTTLDLSTSRLGSDGVAVLAPSLRHLRRLADLRLQRNNIGLSGVHVLAPAIKELQGLTHLDLLHESYAFKGHCWVPSEGPEALVCFKMIADAARHLPGLVERVRELRRLKLA